MRFFTIQKLGPKRSLTPEGFLLCEDVPVARTGEMLYAAGEVPIEPGPDGLIRISRTPEEVFRDATLASCQGKDVTLDHPDDFVQPSNYAGLTQGVMLNPRRSTSESDLLVADLLIKHPDTIAAVQDEEIEEVSLGYEADYEQVSPGRGVQRNIVVNHVAIVPRGRCGPRCAIGDKEPEMKTKDSKPKRSTWLDRLMKSLKIGDEDGVEEALEEGKKAMDEESEEERKKREAAEAGKTGDNALILKTLRSLDRRMARIESRDAERERETEDEEEEEEEEEDPGSTTDTIIEAEPSKRVSETGVDLYTGDSARRIPARAEILAPGVKLPTLDGMKTKDRAAALCRCQRKALDQAYQTDAGRAAIAPFLGSRTPDFDTMPARVLDTIFTGAAELMRATNNAGTSSGKVTTRDFGKPTSIAEINERNRKFWSGQSSQ
ncbi:putative bacteriophage protein [Burkholderia multivorans]